MTPPSLSRVAPALPILQRASAAAAVRSHRADRRALPARAVAGAPLLIGIESVLPTLILVLVVVTVNLGAMPNGIDSFLGIRVTVKNVLLSVGLIAACTAVLRACRVYDARAVRKRAHEIARMFLACSVCTGFTLAFPLTSVGGGVRFSDLGFVWIGLLAAETVIRGSRRFIAHRSRKGAPRRVVIAGTGPRAMPMWAEFTSDDSAAYELVGFVDTHRGSGARKEMHGRSVGTIEDLEGILMRQAIDEVFIALPIKSRYREFQHVISVCERVGVRAKYRTDMFRTWVAWQQAERGSHSVVSMNVAPDDYRLAFKRAFDIVGAVFALTVFSPVMVLAALAVKLTSRGPVLFAQERCGFNKRSFRMLKFRTMVANADALQAGLESRNEAEGPVFKISDDPRVTWVGRILRKTSMDELPQLFNVLKGEMSLVGPRPLTLRDVRRFRRSTDMRRFSVTPGLTCLWQISGRSQLGFGEWVRLDLKYIDGWSLGGDLRILAWTIPAVLRGTGAM